MTGMTDAEFGAVELVDDDAPEFFAPADTDMLDGLLGQYRHARAGVEEIAAFMASRLEGGAIDYFLDGNQDENRGRHSMGMSARQLFEQSGAIVMNPPFSGGRWQAHLQHAAGMLAPGGRLSAILPSGAKTRAADLLAGLTVTADKERA